MERRRISFYRSLSGGCPVEEFLDSLSPAEVKRIAWLLELIRDLENIPAEYFKKLRGSDEIWEGRIQLGTRGFRVLGFFYSDRMLVLTNGFSKKSQKTPRREIETAERYKRDYLERSGRNG